MSTDMIPLDDEHARADLATFCSRARRLDEEGAVRLLGAGRALAAYVLVDAGHGLLSDGVTLGMRVLPLARDWAGDVTVPLSAVLDRLARRPGEQDAAGLPVPPVTLAPQWAATSPPRGGWEPAGRIPAADLRDVADQGISEIAEAARESAVGAAEARDRVWARMTHTEPSIPAGLAFGAHVLGFLADDPGVVLRSGPWTRLTTERGHVLRRGTASGPIDLFGGQRV